jgi:hypothetical protein
MSYHTVLSLRPQTPYVAKLAEINRDLDTLTKITKRLFDTAVKDPVVTQEQMDLLQFTYERLRAAQQEVDELYLIAPERFGDGAQTEIASCEMSQKGGLKNV